MSPIAVGKYLVIDPRVCHGKLTFKGTRLPVEIVLYCLSEGMTIESILEDWSYLRREAIVEAIQLAAAALEASSTKAGTRDGAVNRRRATRRKKSARSAAPTV